ncbi:Magnesium and cobalt efflux protein CorC [Pseudobythopirellula maris]|uniref:Magnesium and cobalt efflux protein CorC n=1 Tax=Pseudobythopirellula maris TaxID=2527991 RepID=A0A5C5ZHB6_9BACT|nr:CNNM domain-containing protein [Pseudobythopirellula maris]TWT86548.1 Magnesium and cobalt efflux protein CorC [Pseudobythopirellula maris]
MEPLLKSLPELLAMAVLMALSGFFSCSEAAMFSLSRESRAAMGTGRVPERAAMRLLADPERLLTSILLWNLVINIAFFALASVLTLRLERAGESVLSKGVALASLLLIIIFSEMLPKNVGILWPRGLAAAVSLPLGAATKLVDPLLPALRATNNFAERLLIPRLEPEPYLELADLERAVALGSDANDPHLDDDQEQSARGEALEELEREVLHRVVALAGTRVDEVMRPRKRYAMFRPPVSLVDLEGEAPPSGYVLITEPDSDEIVAALPTTRLALLPAEHLERYAESVATIPWCATCSSALSELQETGCRVAAVINEYGDTIGVVTREDLLDAIFSDPETHASDWHWIRPVGVKGVDGDDETACEAAGGTPLRRLAKRFGVEFPESKSVTVAGLLHELLEHAPQEGDRLVWGGLVWVVVSTTEGHDGSGDTVARIAPASPADFHGGGA